MCFMVFIGTFGSFYEIFRLKGHTSIRLRVGVLEKREINTCRFANCPRTTSTFVRTQGGFTDGTAVLGVDIK